ncbi:MAG: tetratricopeptide repeat protein [Cyclobacteriaceae bacterium]
MKRQVIFGLIFLLASFAVQAQPGWNWPADVETAKEKNALYTDALKSNQYTTAIESHSWLLENAPNLNKSLYINGAKIYEGLAKKEADAAKKVEYQDKALSMYDLRIEHFGDEGNVLNRKAFVAYKYYKGNKSKYKDLLDLYDRTFTLNGDNTLDNNLVAYMDVIRRFKLSGGDISDETVIEKYGIVSDVIDAKIKKGKNVERLKKYQENVDKLLTATVTVDCKFVENNLGPKMKETGDLNMAKKVFGLMLTGKCTDSPLFLEAAVLLFEKEPDFGLAKVIAVKHSSAGELDKAHEYYDKAIEYSDDDLKKAEIYYSKAQLYSNKGQKSAARTHARKALAIDPSMKDAYSMIGNLYMQSYEECRQGVSKVDDRLVFIAAFNQYQKAGNSQMMQNAKEQFPSIGEIFELGLTEGQVMNCGCWINESVKLARRP